MNIFNNLEVSYRVESKSKKGEFRTYTFLIDGEDILIQNPKFWNLTPNEQLPTVNSFIEKDRIRCKTKEFYYQKWIPTNI